MWGSGAKYGHVDMDQIAFEYEVGEKKGNPFNSPAILKKNDGMRRAFISNVTNIFSYSNFYCIFCMKWEKF